MIWKLRFALWFWTLTDCEWRFAWRAANHSWNVYAGRSPISAARDEAESWKASVP